MPSSPRYRKALQDGHLAAAARSALEALSDCRLCPRHCGVNRLQGEAGFCRTGRRAWVSSVSAHFGEEAPLVGSRGSGTVFFTHCNLDCVFCQNYDISHLGSGQPVEDADLADGMLALQNAGCHNVNLVSPSHVVPQVLAAIRIAADNGLRIPIVYNSGGYDSVETLRRLEGVVDIYMPDFKYWDAEAAQRHCGVADYPETARAALAEMHRQVGDLVVDSRGVAVSGMIIRHLIMPKRGEDTRAILAFISEALSPDSYVNLMPQYRPCGRAREFPELASGITAQDLEDAVDAARRAGLRRKDA